MSGFESAVEEAGLLSFAADNGPFLINMFGFLAVEPAKLAIPAVSCNREGLLNVLVALYLRVVVM